MTVRPYSDAMDRAHDVAVARIERGLADLGMTDAFGGMMPGGLMPDYGTNGNLLIYRPRTRDGKLTSEPDYIGVLDREPWLSDADLQTLDRHVSRHVRRTLRERAIAKAVGEERDADPQWSFTMHRLARAMLLEVQLSPTMFINGRDRTWDLAIPMLAGEKGMELGAHHVEDGRVDLHSVSWRDLELVGKGRPCVVIDQTMPDTLAAALAGRLLSAAISHPAVNRAGPIRIVQADVRSTFTTLILEDVQDFVRRPPPGTDRRWTRVPFLPTTTD